MLIFRPDWGLGGGFITVQNKNREILEQRCALFLFCCEIPSLQHSSVFLATQKNHFLFQMGQTLPFIRYPTLWALQNRTNPGSGSAKLHHPTLHKRTTDGGKRWRGIYCFFLSGAATLFCHMEHRRGQRHTSAPHSPPHLLHSPPPRLLSEELLLCSLEQRGCDSWQTSCQLHRSGGSHYFLLPHCSVVLGQDKTLQDIAQYLQCVFPIKQRKKLKWAINLKIPENEAAWLIGENVPKYIKQGN